VFAGRVEDRDGVAVDLLGEPDRPFPAVEQFLQQMPSARQLHLLEVVTVKVEQVERVEDGIARGQLASPAAERTLQCPEVRSSLLVQNDSLAVQDGARDTEIACRLGDAGEALRPVMTSPGKEADAAGFNVDRASIAVELDLGDVARVAGGLAFRSAKAGSMRSGIGSRSRFGCAGSRRLRARLLSGWSSDSRGWDRLFMSQTSLGKADDELSMAHGMLRWRRDVLSRM